MWKCLKPTQISVGAVVLARTSPPKCHVPPAGHDFFTAKVLDSGRAPITRPGRPVRRAPSHTVVDRISKACRAGFQQTPCKEQRAFFSFVAQSRHVPRRGRNSPQRSRKMPSCPASHRSGCSPTRRPESLQRGPPSSSRRRSSPFWRFPEEARTARRSEEHTSELQSRENLV